MRRAMYQQLGCALATALVLVACASGEDKQPATDPPSEPTTSVSATAPEPSANAKVCIAKCKTDAECQNTCATPAAGGISCCDVGDCYTNGTGKCPVKLPDPDPKPAY